MATIKLLVRSKVKGRLAPISLRFKNGKETDLMVVTDYKIYPEYWSNETQTIKQRVHHTNAFTQQDKVNLEAKLLDLKNLVLKSCNQKTAQGSPVTREWLISLVNQQGKPQVEKVTLNMFLSSFIKEIESGERLYNHNNRTERYKSGTIRNYKGFQEQFDQFQASINKKLNYDDITVDLYDRLVVFFNKKKYSPNTIGRHIKNLKVIMRLSRDQGLHNNNEIDRKKFKSVKVPVQEIYLTENEVTKLYELDLTDKKEHEVARDVFLIGCYTAQRFSDYSRIKEEHIRDLDNGTKVIDIIQKKTGEQVIIPMKPELIALLEKYNYRMPKTFEQKVNKRIKEVGKLAGISSTINKEEIKGGLKVTRSVPKHDLIKTHTARRTGCTNMYLGGVNVIDIMKISGHKSEREFLSYIKVSKEETAHTLSNHPYFNHTKLKVV
jgi:integrase